MSVKLRLPNLTATTNEGKLQQLQGYLYQLVGELNWAMQAVDPGNAAVSGGSGTTAGTGNISVIAGGNGKKPDPEDTFNSIKALIIKSAEILDAYQEAISQSLEGEYVATSDFGTYKSETSNAMEATDQKLGALLRSYEEMQSHTGEFDDQTLERISKLEATAKELNLSFTTIRENGADKVVTSQGYSFSDAGLQIGNEESEVANLLTNTGMTVSAGTQNVLRAGAEGVNAINITVGRYLTVGEHARFEDYGADRTACFYI